MDPITLGMLGIGLGGSMINAFGHDTNSSDYDTENYLNKSGEAYKQYDKFSNMNSDYYQTGENEIRKTISDSMPGQGSLLAMMAAGGGGTSGANIQRQASMRQAGDTAKSGMVNMYQQGQGLAQSYLGMAYSNAREQMKGVTDEKIRRSDRIGQTFNQFATAGIGMAKTKFDSGLPSTGSLFDSAKNWFSSGNNPRSSRYSSDDD